MSRLRFDSNLESELEFGARRGKAFGGGGALSPEPGEALVTFPPPVPATTAARPVASTPPAVVVAPPAPRPPPPRPNRDSYPTVLVPDHLW